MENTQNLSEMEHPSVQVVAPITAENVEILEANQTEENNISDSQEMNADPQPENELELDVSSPNITENNIITSLTSKPIQRKIKRSKSKGTRSHLKPMKSIKERKGPKQGDKKAKKSLISTKFLRKLTSGKVNKKKFGKKIVQKPKAKLSLSSLKFKKAKSKGLKLRPYGNKSVKVMAKQGPRLTKVLYI